MSAGDRPLLTLGGLATREDTFVHVLEPAAAAPDVCRQLQSGTYGKAFLVEDARTRALQFALDGSVQSEMRIDDPDALVNEYTRKMMAFLLFCPQPRHILMIGLGGGSLVKYCYRKLPDVQVTAVEIDANVLALRSRFQIPPDDSRLRIVHADGAQHVADMVATGEHVDVLLVDAYDRHGIAPSVAAPEFIDNARSVLSNGGVFVMNLAAYEAECALHQRTIRAVFGEPVITVTVGWGGNTIAFAGPALQARDRLAMVASRARAIRERLDLNFRRLPKLVDDCLPFAQSGTQDGESAS